MLGVMIKCTTFGRCGYEEKIFFDSDVRRNAF